jgi:hypothetical protein
MISRRSSCILATLVAVMVACDRPKGPASGDTGAATSTRGAESTTVNRPQLWDSSAGTVLLVAGDAPTESVVVPPDTATASATLASVPRPASVTLLGRGGTVQSAELQPPAESLACHAWTVSAAPPPRPWSIGFVGGVVAPQPMDSIESLGRADSLALTAVVTRLASGLPNDPAGRFSGLPFITRTLWRFTIPSGHEVLVGILVRQINQEATPLQERTLLIAERDRATNDSTFALAYHERAYGAEETIETSEVLGGALIGPGRRPTLVVSRDFGNAVGYSFIDREDGRWRARWSSGRRTCLTIGVADTPRRTPGVLIPRRYASSARASLAGGRTRPATPASAISVSR